MNDSPATSGDGLHASFFVNTPPSSNHDVTIPKKEKDVAEASDVTKKAVKRKYTNAELSEIADKEVRKKLRNRQSALAARWFILIFVIYIYI